MTTHRIPIMGISAKPKSSDVFFEPYNVKAGTPAYDFEVCIFKDTATRIGINFSFLVPKNYVGTPKLAIRWTAVPTTGNVRWEFDSWPVEPGEDTDAVSAVSNQIVGTAPGTTLYLVESLLTLTAGYVAGDSVLCSLWRDGAEGDTLADAAILFPDWLAFEYSDA